MVCKDSTYRNPEFAKGQMSSPYISVCFRRSNLKGASCRQVRAGGLREVILLPLHISVVAELSTVRM